MVTMATARGWPSARLFGWLAANWSLQGVTRGNKDGLQPETLAGDTSHNWLESPDTTKVNGPAEWGHQKTIVGLTKKQGRRIVVQNSQQRMRVVFVTLQWVKKQELWDGWICLHRIKKQELWDNCFCLQRIKKQELWDSCLCLHRIKKQELLDSWLCLHRIKKQELWDSCLCLHRIKKQELWDSWLCLHRIKK